MRLNFRVSTAAGLMPNYHTPISHKLIPLFITAALVATHNLQLNYLKWPGYAS